MSRKPIDYVVVTLKGMAMGAADAVPGVSGGTIALVSGIYEELVKTIANIDVDLIRILLRGRFKLFWEKANGNFVLALGLGIVLSYVSFMKLAKYLLEFHPVLIWSFFLGLIIASIWYMAKQIPKWNLVNILFLILGILFGYLLTQLPISATSNDLIYFFACAAIAICAMILPGISGSFILILLGSYQTLSTAIAEFDMKKLVVFVFGAVIGLLSFSRLLKWLLKKYNSQTFALLTGLIIGSIGQVWPWKVILETKVFDEKIIPVKVQSVSPFSFEGDPQLFAAIGLAMVGFSLIFILERLAAKK